jgi:hypothetical protein
MRSRPEQAIDGAPPAQYLGGMNLITQTCTDVQLAQLVVQLQRRGLVSLIPFIIGGAPWRVERGRLWVYLDADANPPHD